MVRPGTILSLGQRTRPDYEYADGVTFRIYELADGDEFTSVVVTPRGARATRLTARRSGKRITASISGDVPRAGEFSSRVPDG
jgi:alpha-D-xyloside xylohydrolase